MNNQIKVLGKSMNITNNSDAVSNFLHVNILINVKYLINMCKICHFLTVGNIYIEFYIITLHITYNKKQHFFNIIKLVLHRLKRCKLRQSRYKKALISIGQI